MKVVVSSVRVMIAMIVSILFGVAVGRYIVTVLAVFISSQSRIIPIAIFVAINIRNFPSPMPVMKCGVRGRFPMLTQNRKHPAKRRTESVLLFHDWPEDQLLLQRRCRRINNLGSGFFISTG